MATVPRHALDFRLMIGRRVAILDASLPLGTSRPSQGHGKPSVDTVKTKGSKYKDMNKSKRAPGKALSTERFTPETQIGVLRPIPGLGLLIQDAVREATLSWSSLVAPTTSTVTTATSVSDTDHASHIPRSLLSKTNFVHLDNGLICEVGAVELIAPRIH